jgi:hypothetical protein
LVEASRSVAPRLAFSLEEGRRHARYPRRFVRPCEHGDQTCDNQSHELRRYCEARGWTATEYVDTGVSGAKDWRLAAYCPITRMLVLKAKRLSSGSR